MTSSGNANSTPLTAAQQNAQPLATVEAINKQQAALGAAEAKKNYQSAHTPNTMKRGK